MLVNMGNQPHCDYGEGQAARLPLTRFLLSVLYPGLRPLRVLALGFAVSHFQRSE
jgi:hypothetical protein